LGDKPGVERRTIGIGVEQETVLILRGNTARVLGEGRAHLFLKGNGDRTITWRTLPAGEKPLVLQSAAGRIPRPDLPSVERAAGVPNPFGMPLPAEPSRWGTVVLHGGGDTDEIIDMYPQLAGGPQARLVHCPAARESCRPSAGRNGKSLAAHLEGTFFEWRKLPTDGRVGGLTVLTAQLAVGANRAACDRAGTKSDALWVCGC